MSQVRLDQAPLSPVVPVPAFLTEGGALGAMMRALPWETTPLGPPQSWPAALSTLVSVMLSANQPMFVAWGEARTLIYNDRYAEVLGDKHPAALGRPFFEVWAEIRAEVEPIMARGYAGQPTTMDDLALTMNRRGYPEETHFAFSYTPVRGEDGAVAGVFCACTETTAQVMAERRRLEMQQRLSASEGRCRTLFEAMAEGFFLGEAIRGEDGTLVDFRFLELNPAFGALTGLDPDAVVNRTCREVIPEVPEAIFERYARALDGERSDPFEVRIPTLNDRWYEARVQRAGPETFAVLFIEITERKAAETALFDSETRMRAMLEAFSDGFYALDAEWRFTVFNAASERFFGRSRTDVLGRRLFDVFPEAKASEFEQRYRRVVERGEPETFETRSRAQPTVFVEMRAAPTGDGGLVVAFSDISRRRLADAALRAATFKAETLAAEQAAILGQLAEGVIVTDRHGRISFVNEAAARIHGVARLDVEPDTYHLFTEDGRPYPPEALPLARAVRNRETVRDARWRIRRPDGTEVLALGTARPVVSATGEEIGAVLTLSDDTAREASERRLRESEARLRALADNLPAGMVYQLVMNADGSDRRFVYVSQGNRQLTGVPAEAVLADPERAYDRILPSYRGPVAEEEARCIEALAPFDLEAPIRHAETGEVRWTRFVSAPRRLPDGKLIWDGLQIDVTERRLAETALRELNATLETRIAQAVAERGRAEEQLRQAQKMEAVGQLTGGIAHDFNNLLTGIIGSLDLLQRRVDAGRYENLERYTASAMTSAQRAAALTQRLLAFARRQPLDPKRVAVDALLGGMADLLTRTLGPAIALELVPVEGLWPTLCDPNQLESAILNLAINARDAMPDGGRLTIGAANATLDEASVRSTGDDVVPGAYVLLSVSDNGTGMPPEVVERAFEPFFTTKPAGQGTGLGLSMLYGFVKQSNGHVRIESEPGRGTTFRLYLPLHDGPVPAEEPVPHAAPDVREADGRVVLLVEDEAAVRQLVAETLQDLGYTVLEAGDGPAGLRLLLSTPDVDLLVTDVGLPGLNGRQLADAARQQRPSLKVLFITGYTGNAGVGNAVLEPGMAMLTKPFALDTLTAKVRTILDAPTLEL